MEVPSVHSPRPFFTSGGCGQSRDGARRTSQHGGALCRAAAFSRDAAGVMLTLRMRVKPMEGHEPIPAFPHAGRAKGTPLSEPQPAAAQPTPIVAPADADRAAAARARIVAQPTPTGAQPPARSRRSRPRLLRRRPPRTSRRAADAHSRQARAHRYPEAAGRSHRRRAPFADAGLRGRRTGPRHPGGRLRDPRRERERVEALDWHPVPGRGGREAEGTRLLSEYGGQTPSRVRIPPSPCRVVESRRAHGLGRCRSPHAREIGACA